MTYTYTWTDAEQTSLKREDADGNVAYVPVAEGNRDYAEFLASGETAAAYVEPSALPEPTDTEKLERSTGLTVAEIKGVLYSDLITRIEALEADHATLMSNNGGSY